MKVKMLHKVYHMMQISIFFIFRRNLSAFEYDDFPALTSTVKPHSNKTKRSPGNHQSHFSNFSNINTLVVKRKKGGKPVVAQLDRVVSNYTRHKLLDQQQIKMSEQENLQQRLQTLPLPAAMVIGRTNEVLCNYNLNCYIHYCVA